MDKKIAGLLGAAAALTAVTAAQAAIPVQNSSLTAAASYRDLLNPVPDALTALRADNGRVGQSGTFETAETIVIKKKKHHHHHHHHHHHYD